MKNLNSETLTKKQKTHKRMLDAAGQSFRCNGFAGIGVDGIAKAAGVTSGAFYAHFGSKGSAFQAVLIAGLDEVIVGIPKFQHDFGTNWVSAFSDYYLGRPHQEDLAGGCAMATLTPEVARSEDELRAIYETKMTRVIDCAIDGLAGGSEQNKEARAWAMLATLIGGLNIVRAMTSAELIQEVADGIKAAAVQAAGQTRGID